MAKHQVYGKEFYDLAIQVNNTLMENDSVIGDQKEQVELLFKLEQEFKKLIQKHEQHITIYEKFIDFIVDGGNILNAQPYFREKTDVFSSKISKAIKKKDAKTLVKFDINYQLINFIMNNWKGRVPSEIQKTYDSFVYARKILIENNLPLAINRAKLFFRKTPKSQLTLLDLIDICTHGLISGVDKYVGEYSKVWRSVCIGRMVGYMIEEYSKTFLRMYPIDKKVLYRANSLKARLKIDDIEELTKAVNESFKEDKENGKAAPKLPISSTYILTLLNGSGYISAAPKNDDSGEDNYSIYSYTADDTPSAEDSLIQKDLMFKIAEASKDLTVIERKILKLRGIDI